MPMASVDNETILTDIVTGFTLQALHCRLYITGFILQALQCRLYCAGFTVQALLCRLYIAGFTLFTMLYKRLQRYADFGGGCSSHAMGHMHNAHTHDAHLVTLYEPQAQCPSSHAIWATHMMPM